MNGKHLIWIIGLTFLVTFASTLYFSWEVDNINVGEYDLYNCIYNNADSNGFPQHPLMIQKVQDECVCFRQYDYNLSKVMDEGLC